MAQNYLKLVFLAAVLFVQSRASCPNMVAEYHGPNERTMAANITIFVVPCPIAAVEEAVNKAYALLLTKPVLQSLPKSLNFPKGMHPVLVSSSLDSDIRQSSAYIDGSLRGTGFTVPFVGTGKSDTPFTAALFSYLGGTENTLAAFFKALVPTAVSSAAEGLPMGVGTFVPADAAYQNYGTGPSGNPLYSSITKFDSLPNFFSGPGLYPAAADMYFSSNESESMFPVKQVADMINQPNLLNAPFNTVGITTCQRNTYYFTNQTANVQYRFGNVTLGGAAGGLSIGLVPGALQKASPDKKGNYVGVHGISACVQIVGYNAIGGQPCEVAATAVDKVTT